MEIGHAIEMLDMGQPFTVDYPLYALVVDRIGASSDPNKLVIMRGGYRSGAGIGKCAGESFYLPDRSTTGLKWRVITPSDELLVLVLIAAYALGVTK